MNLKGIVQIGKNEYVVEELSNFSVLSLFAAIGSRAICLADKKVYVYLDINKWVSLLNS